MSTHETFFEDTRGFLKFRGKTIDVWVNPKHVVTVLYNTSYNCVEMRLSGDRLVLAVDFDDPELVIHYLETGAHPQRYSVRNRDLPPGQVGLPDEPFGFIHGGHHD
jgi:hypothetical protein